MRKQTVLASTNRVSMHTPPTPQTNARCPTTPAAINHARIPTTPAPRERGVPPCSEPTVKTVGVTTPDTSHHGTPPNGGVDSRHGSHLSWVRYLQSPPSPLHTHHGNAAARRCGAGVSHAYQSRLSRQSWYTNTPRGSAAPNSLNCKSSIVNCKSHGGVGRCGRALPTTPFPPLMNHIFWRRAII